MRHRSAIEPVIKLFKDKHPVIGCDLVNTTGDTFNAIPAAAGQNFA